MVPPDSNGVSRAPPYSGAQPDPYSDFAYGTLTPSGPPFQARSAILSRPSTVRSLNPGQSLDPPVWAPPLSLAATQGISFDFSSSGYLDVSVPRVGSLLSKGDGLSPAGFPHSDISGSMLACSSPKLFAACHVLPRRSVPRHPPCALPCLTSFPSLSKLDHTLLSLLTTEHPQNSPASRPESSAQGAPPRCTLLSLHPTLSPSSTTPEPGSRPVPGPQAPASQHALAPRSARPSPKGHIPQNWIGFSVN
jgi:hypothetical protein